RWGASGTAATELGNLGQISSRAYALNAAGTAVGSADKAAGRARAVRWDASGTAATELGSLDTDGFSEAYAINAAGTVVGYSATIDGETVIGKRAALWGADAVAVDVNTLIDPAGGWNLFEASSISDTNWVGGWGDYDPDGTGPLEAYSRAFLLQVPATVPEPGPGLIALPAGA